MKAKSDILDRISRAGLISFGALLLFLMQGFYSPAIAQHQAASNHVQGIALGKSVFKKVAPNIRIVKASLDPQITKQNFIINQSKTYQAFSIEHPQQESSGITTKPPRIFDNV